jgi:DNA-binding transcriptional ArsR family regulator
MSPLNEVRGELLDAMTTRSPDALLSLVADRHRRQALQQLRKDTDGETTIDDLIDRLLGDDSLANATTVDREQLAIELYHAHLPRLADHGVVEFDPESRAVRYQPDEQIETFLDSLPDELSVART